MALTNAEKQKRWRERNQVVLTDRAEEIAEKLIDMEDQKKLRKISRLINNHLKNPNRSAIEKAVDLGQLGAGRGRSGKKAAVSFFNRFKVEMQELDRAYMASEITEEEYKAVMAKPAGEGIPDLVRTRVELRLRNQSK